MVQRVRTTAQHQTIGEMLGALADDGKAWITAELAVIKAQIEANTRQLLTAIILLMLAVVIALAGIIVLAHTLVLMLAPYFGATLAGLSIGLLLVILAIAFLFYARSLVDLSGFIPEHLGNIRVVDILRKFIDPLGSRVCVVAQIWKIFDGSREVSRCRSQLCKTLCSHMFAALSNRRCYG